MSTIPIEECNDRSVYKLHSRNLVLGVYSERRKGFIGIRTKFGDRYLFTEIHADAGGTAYPTEYVGELPNSIELKENTPSKDRVTGRRVAFDRPIADGGKGWYFVRGGESSEDIRPYTSTYRPLLKWLDAKQEEVKA